MNGVALLLALALTACAAAPGEARPDDGPWVWACVGGAAGPVGLVGGRCAYRKVGEDACVIDPLALFLYAAAGCAGAAVAVRLGRGDAPAGSPRPAPDGGP